jgi:hypothetical protein
MPSPSEPAATVIRFAIATIILASAQAHRRTAVLLRSCARCRR